VLICAGCACQGRTRDTILASPIRDRLINREIKCGEIQRAPRVVSLRWPHRRTHVVNGLTG
jgi:hypothetical protein